MGISMPTKNTKRKQPDDYHILAAKRGFRWLGPEVPTTKTLTNWECPRGHQWRAIYNNIQQGRDCPFCARKKTVVDYQLLARNRNFEWIGPYVTSNIFPTKWKCEFGHEWIASYREVLRGDCCPNCSNTPVKTVVSINEEISVENKIYDDLQINGKTSEIEIFDTEPSFDWWGKNSVNFLRPLFAITKNFIRLSTGFFSIQGYNLLKSYLENKQLDILVGYDDRSRDELKMTLIDEIMDDLGKWKGNRREAVINLIEKLEKRELRIVDARLRKKDHSKIYIFDGHYVVSGSTNLTKNGLLINQEGDLAISKIEQPDRVEWWCKQYENYWNAPDTLDVSQILLERLIAWLGLCKPWDVYLKTIQILAPENKPIVPRENYKVPTEFQMVVVDRAIRQLSEWRGAMIVASTGLGKTIIATHIAYKLLHVDHSILNVLIVAPKPVKDEWLKRMRSAGIPASIHTRNLLDMPLNEDKYQKALSELLDALSEVDDKWLIIIDESQHFKNQVRGQGGERRSFTRLIDIVNEKKCQVLLLTATPYATELDNINHQLLLLPHTSPNESPHQRAIPGLEPDKLYLHSWKIMHVEDLVNLPVGTVINTPYVAQNFAVQSEEGDYLMFGDKKKYIPMILISKVKVPVLLETSVTKVLDENYFKHHLMKFMSRGKWTRSTSAAESEVIISWGSSPWALKEVVEKTIQEKGGYEYPFIYNLEERKKALVPLLIELNKMKYEDDEKFMTLLLLVRELRKAGHKILIFSERLITAVYIEKGLQTANPNLRIANTVTSNASEYIQKDFQEVYHLMIGFAPRSNSREDGFVPEDKYDILITTDAYSQGVNLQDASTVIHYDIAWTPDTIIQRAGRILRFWPNPRLIHFYVFAGTYQQDTSHNKQSLRLQGRLNKLISRNKEAEKFSEIPYIPEETKQFDSLRGLSSLPIELLGYVGTRNFEDKRLDVSTFLTHLTEYKNNSEYAKKIPDDISSALINSKIHSPKLYVLMKYQKKYHWMLYDIIQKRIEKLEEDQLLNLIKCTKDTPTALIDANEIEKHQQNCINLWCEKKNLDEGEREEVVHICSLYISPEEKTLDRFLSK
jgi:superfamily II DNA or RNA helicase